MNVVAKSLLARDQGKGAIFIRSVLEYLYESGESSLADTQAYGMTRVGEEGGTISLNYVKSCCRDMQDAKLIEYQRKGKGYKVDLTDFGVDWFEKLEDVWGTNLNPWPQLSTDSEAAAEVKRRPNRRIKSGEMIDHLLWRAYLAAQRSGELDIIFVKAGTRVKIAKEG